MRKLILTLLLCCASLPALASEQSDELAQTKQERDEATAAAAKISADVKKLDIERKALQLQSVKLAAEIQKNEAEISAIEEKLKILAAQIADKQATLLARKKDLAVMVAAAIKIGQTPPEAVILMPGDTMQSMKASRALKMTADSVKREAESIRAQMAELQALKDKVTDNQKDANNRKAALDEKRITLKAQIAQRDKLWAQLNAQQKDASEKARSLAKKTDDMESLIAALEEERNSNIDDEGREIKADRRAPEGTKGRLRSFAAAKGHIRTPVAGRLEQDFGVEGVNDTSKGVTILTRANAEVTAPFDGEVVFTGPFLAYGRMIIIRHSDGFHTLLAGLRKIDASVGQFLLEGEPIGAMGDRESGNRLYVELRKNNQPVDPAPWIHGLSK